ncbi:MAG: hypothetical protein NDJ90_14130 [Oligoflexia bacterium]|nr:hypothetical protein [Oligoflexia bacterium]
MRAWLATLLLLLSGFSGATALGAEISPPGSERRTKLAWEALEGATRYEFELARRETMQPILKKETPSNNALTLLLKPGKYFFRIRGLAADGKPGPWSDVTPFEVKLPPAGLLAPAEKEVLERRVGGPTITFRWQEQGAGVRYLFEVYAGKKRIVGRALMETQFDFKPLRPGEYRWRAGYQHAQGQEWSPFRTLIVRPAAFLPPEEVAPIAEPLPAPPQPGLAEKANAAEYWLIGRLAQSVVAYQAQDYDSGQTAAGAALVRLLSTELRWRAPRSARSPWGLSGALNLEVIRQNVLETNFTLPRGYARLFATRLVDPRWRLGPFVQFSVNRSGVFMVQGATQALTATITRMSPGAGFTAVYTPTPSLLFSFIGLVRYDLGGEAVALPSAVDSNFGYETGFGVALNLSPKLMLEGRLRVLEERFTWTPANAAAAGGKKSSLTDTFIILDAGFGYRF